MRSLVARKPVNTIRHNAGSTPITTGAWVEIEDSLAAPASAVEIFNATGRVLRVSTGAAGLEDSSEAAYTIIPGGSEILVPSEWRRLSRLSMKAVDANATTGYIILNFFG